MEEFMFIVALAGGFGTRLWPYSKSSKPKQILSIKGQDSFLKNSIEHLHKLTNIDKLYVVTNGKFKDQIDNILDEISPILKNQVLCEPCPKSTLPALAWSIRHLLVTKKAKKSDLILVTPTDHVFSNYDALQKAIQVSKIHAENGLIVSFGIKPKRAETGYGYIRKSDELTNGCFSVESFIEKPDVLLARKFIENDDWLWNMGIYLLTIETFLEEIKLHVPSLYRFMNVETHHEDYVFSSLSSLSIDHGIIEKTTRLITTEVTDTSWSDIGTWESLYDYLDKDSNQNVLIGPVVQIDTKNSLVFAEKKVISTLGLDNLIIVDTDDALLVAKKSDSNKVKELLEIVKERKSLEPDAHEVISTN